MLKSLFFKNILGLGMLLGLCSFIAIELPMLEGTSKNELEIADSKISLNFGGYEEFGSGLWFESREVSHFLSDIYLSDIDLDNANQKTREKIILRLSNYMEGDHFVDGTYQVKTEDYLPKNSQESIVYANLLNQSREGKDLKITSGKIKYAGIYPNILIEFDLQLSNGQQVKGNFDRKMKDFKYTF